MHATFIVNGNATIHVTIIVKTTTLATYNSVTMTMYLSQQQQTVMTVIH